MTNHNSETESTPPVTPSNNDESSSTENTSPYTTPEESDTAVLPEVETTAANTTSSPPSSTDNVRTSVPGPPPAQQPTHAHPYRKGVNMTGVVYACIVMIMAVVAGLVAFRIHFDITLFTVGACTLIAILLIVAALLPNRSSHRE